MEEEYPCPQLLPPANDPNGDCGLHFTCRTFNVCEDDDSTAFSYSPPLTASKSSGSPPDTPPLASPLERDSSLFSCCTNECQEGVSPPVSVSSVSIRQEGGEELWEYARLARAVNMLCGDWGEADTGGDHLEEEQDLRFFTFETPPERMRSDMQWEDRGKSRSVLSPPFEGGIPSLGISVHLSTGYRRPWDSMVVS